MIFSQKFVIEKKDEMEAAVGFAPK